MCKERLSALAILSTEYNLASKLNDPTGKRVNKCNTQVSNGKQGKGPATFHIIIIKTIKLAYIIGIHF
jgi:hypothetical protein